MKIEGLYREKGELLATEVCWLLIAACVCVCVREREREYKDYAVSATVS